MKHSFVNKQFAPDPDNKQGGGGGDTQPKSRIETNGKPPATEDTRAARRPQLKNAPERIVRNCMIMSIGGQPDGAAPKSGARAAIYLKLRDLDTNQELPYAARVDYEFAVEGKHTDKLVVNKMVSVTFDKTIEGKTEYYANSDDKTDLTTRTHESTREVFAEINTLDKQQEDFYTTLAETRKEAAANEIKSKAQASANKVMFEQLASAGDNSALLESMTRVLVAQNTRG